MVEQLAAAANVGLQSLQQLKCLLAPCTESPHGENTSLPTPEGL